jgi:peptide deformylase
MNYKLGPHDSLAQMSTDWDFEKDGDAKELEKSMIDFMLTNHGIGLAANQIGITKKVFVMGSHNIEGFPTPFAVFNPRVLEVSEEQELDKEGCLSYPDLWLSIKRPKVIKVAYQDSDATWHEVAMSGYIARCFLHEFDHLNGVCFVDIVSPMKLQLAMKKLRKHK